MRVILTLLGSVFGTRRHRHLRCFAWKPCLLDPQLLEAYSYVFLKRSRRLELFMVAWYVGILYADSVCICRLGMKTQTDRMVRLLFRSLGWALSEDVEKDCPFSERFQALAVEFD